MDLGEKVGQLSLAEMDTQYVAVKYVLLTV